MVDQTIDLEHYLCMQVDAAGRYSSPIKDVNQRFGTIVSGLTTGRMLIAQVRCTHTLPLPPGRGPVPCLLAGAVQLAACAGPPFAWCSGARCVGTEPQLLPHHILAWLLPQRCDLWYVCCRAAGRR